MRIALMGVQLEEVEVHRAHQRPSRRGAAFLAGSFFAVLIVAVAACSSSDEQSSPRPLSSAPSRRDAGQSSEEPQQEASTAVEPTPTATTYLGTVAETPPVTFGGDPYCEYTIALKDIRIEVTALDTGEVLGAVVKNSVFETSVPPCPHAPMDPADQSFALTTATPTALGVSLAFEGAGTNRPRTALAIDLVKVDGGWEASGAWKRTDQPPPLDWEVKAKTQLLPKGN